MGVIITASNLKFMNLIEYPNISINSGRATFICGESGCGKSTFLKLLNATLSPSEGTISFCGKNIDSVNSIELRREVLLVSQNVFLFDGTIKQCFELYYEYREEKIISDNEIEKYLKLCCIDFPLDTRCETMSGGERQRVFIAICISFMPKMLMLDEPTSALDSATANRLLTQIKEFCKNEITLIVICHSKELVDAYADELIVLDKRRTV